MRWDDYVQSGPACVSGTRAGRGSECFAGVYDQGRKDGGGFEPGVEFALERLLVSPSFLFRTETDPPGVSGNYRLSDLELASRLSFFLWSSIPDDELLKAAEQGKLKDPVVFERQAQRMLADPRSESLTKNFAGQWLQLRNLDSVRPGDPYSYDFDDSLRKGLYRETEMFFDSVLRENRPVLELLTANYTFVNERVALHYGIPNVSGSEFRRVELPVESHRHGILGQGSILTITSHPNRTSPVLRGKWILANVLGTPPADPPPNVPVPGDPPDSSESSHSSRADGRAPSGRALPYVSLDDGSARICTREVLTPLAGCVRSMNPGTPWILPGPFQMERSSRAWTT